MAETALSPLLSTGELAGALASPRPPVLLDVRWEVGRPALYQDFLAGHIPGARFCDLDADLADPPGPAGRHPLPDPVRLQRALRSWGIDDGTPVVCYDGSTSVAAARGWWVLRWAGLSGVRVLNGGFAAWVASGAPVEAGAATPIAQPGTVTVHAGSVPVLTAAEAGAMAAEGLLVDARSAERFRGEMEPIDPVAGHIPGAKNLPASGSVADDGSFRPPAVLLGRLADLGIQSDVTVGVYCGSGVTAAQSLLAMDAAGQSAVLYPGSWSEWITDPERPVAVDDGT